jgi:hypothetical protein
MYPRGKPVTASAGRLKGRADPEACSTSPVTSPHQAVAQALSALCGVIEVVTPEQETEALNELELLGVRGDAKLAIDGLKAMCGQRV